MLTVCSQRSTPQLGLRVAQPVEDHHADRVLHRGGEARAPEDAAETFEPQFAPELVKRPHITQGKSRFEAHLGRGSLARCETTRLEQRLQELVDLAVVLVNAPEVEQIALARLAAVVTEGLHQLGVAMAFDASELDKHGAQCSRDCAKRNYIRVEEFRLHNFAGKQRQVIDLYGDHPHQIARRAA